MLQALTTLTPKPQSLIRSGRDKYKDGYNPVPVLAVGEASPVMPEDRWGVFAAQAQLSLVTPKQVKDQRIRSSWTR